MNKKTTSLLILLLISSLLVSCSSFVITGIPRHQASTNPTVKPTVSPDPSDPIKEKIAGMSIDEKIGQMVLVGLEGTTMQANALEMIETYRIGGFILYKDNISDAPQTVAMLNQLKAANHSNAAPLWLSIDQEGGKVSRMSADFKRFPPAGQIGLVNQSMYSRQIGLSIGEALQALGFNMDFAPVLDINSNPQNPVIGSRSYGADPQTVIKHGITTMKAIQSKQVAAVVKHFPGHGDTSVDSHLELPVVKKSLNELLSFELLPFMEAIKLDTDAIMIAHLLIPYIDEQYPASQSKKIITDLLRKTLKFEGVVITDDMTMRGITKHYDIGEAAVRSVLAGCDILLVGHDYNQQVAVLQALKKNTENGTLSAVNLDRSVYRILHLKSKYNLQDHIVENVDVSSVNQQIEAALGSR